MPPVLEYVMQPICESRSLKIHHHEMLLRNLDDISAHGALIEHAETNGFIPILDFFAATSAIRALDLDPALRVSVNISSYTVEHLADDFLSRIPFAPSIASRLTIEMTETRAPDMDKTRAFRERLAERGIGFSIDDFGPQCGMGYDEMMWLRPDEIKLSGCALTAAMAGNTRHIDQAISSNIRVVAECIDTPEKLEFVRQQDIALVQGYIIHHR